MTFAQLSGKLTARTLAAAVLVFTLSASMAAQATAVAPGELVRRSVENELKQADGPKFMFRQQKDRPWGSETKLLVQTKDAMAGMLIVVDGKLLGPKRRKQEQDRLERLMNEPGALQHKKKQEKEDTMPSGAIA